MPDHKAINLKEIAARFAGVTATVISSSSPAKITAISFGEEGSGYDIHPTSEAVLVLAGAITLDVEGDVVELTEGDFFRIVAGTSHRVVSGKPGILLLFEAL